MTMNGKRLLLAAVLVTLAEIGFLGWVIAGRAAILRSGRDVVLKVEPIDPRDLLRGDYVRFGYEIRQIPVRLVENAPPGEFVTEEGPIFVRLGRDPDGIWRPRSASLSRPSQAPAAAGEVDIKGSIPGGWAMGPGGSLNVDYGIDRYYVPEGAGRRIEEDMRERPFAVAPAHVDAVELGGREDAAFDGFAHPGEGGARAECVHAVTVAGVVAGGDGLEILVEDVGAEADDGLVVGAPDVGESTLLERDDPLARRRAVAARELLGDDLVGGRLFCLFVCRGTLADPHPD